MEVRRRLAANMRRLRKERGLSQEALAHECGYDRTYVSQIERQVTTPSITAVAKIAEALGVSIGELVDGSAGHEAQT